VAHTILGWRFGVKVQAQSSTSGAGRGDEEKKAEEEEGGEEGQNLETSPGRWGKMFKNQKNRKYAA
jgi:hypothetical protein